MGVISAITEEIFAAAGQRRQTVAAMSSFLAAPEVIANSDMVSMVPCYLGVTLVHHPGVKVVPLQPGTARHSIRMVWHNTTHFDPFLGAVRGFVREIAAQVEGAG